jgi:peptidyl-tRNA hydrolase, PTH1 family
MALRKHAERPARRGTPADLLVVGLGNPGKEYERSRHNVGAEVVQRLATAHGATLKAGKERALVAEVRIGEQRVALAFPTTFMNLSGESVAKLVRRYGIEDPSRLVIVQDELDLPPGTVRVKLGGGLAGHNGLRSITQHLKTQDYVRVRIGVGKPPSKERGADHVLDRVPKSERALLDETIVRATEAVELIATHGVDAAMQEHNRS